MRKITQMMNGLLLFKEPLYKEKFISEEKKENTISNSNKTNNENNSKKENKNNLINAITEKFETNKNDEQSTNNKQNKYSKVSEKLQENLDYVKQIYNIPTNGDLIIREFNIIINNKPIKAFMVFIDGLVDRKVIDDNILEPLMLLSSIDIKSNKSELGAFINAHLLPHNQIQIYDNFEQIIDEINFGSCAVFIEGVNISYVADVKGFEHRSVEKPITELVIRGPQEAFSELIRTNTALIRKRLKDEDLIVENLQIGKRSKTPCSILYIRDIANPELVNEVKRRLNSINVDYITDTGELEQLIEDSPYLPSPQVIATERPDRVAAALSEGKVSIIMNGSPFALIVPVTLFELLHSAEDSYIRVTYANALRLIRILSVMVSLLLPALYIAIVNYHQEMIPTDLLFAIEASRQKVPFPTIVEVLIMELSFELIREAGIRIPGPIGPTLGIIGALILGQAAVSANIVSPILIIVVAVTGLGSFAIPNYSLAFSIRILRFAYIFLAALCGFLGITLGLFIHTILLSSSKSFGVPFLAPFAPITKGTLSDIILRPPFWMQEKRPDYLNPQNSQKQPEISREWATNNDNG